MANIRDFHSFRRSDGSLDFSLEMMIESQIETPGLPIIRKLACGNTHLDVTERGRLARLIALQHVRVPYEREFLDRQNKENLEGYLEDMDLAAARVGRPVNAIDVAVSPTAEFPKENSWVRITRAFVENELAAIAADPGKPSREVFFNIADGVGEIFAQMEWTVGYALGCSRFVTSDRPVVMGGKNGAGAQIGITNSNCEITFPLSSTAVLQMRHSGLGNDVTGARLARDAKPNLGDVGQEVKAARHDDAVVQHLNEVHARQAHLYVFSGIPHDWVSDSMQKPAEGTKRKKTLVDADVFLESDNLQGGMTRKREFIVEID